MKRWSLYLVVLSGWLPLAGCTNLLGDFGVAGAYDSIAPGPDAGGTEGASSGGQEGAPKAPGAQGQDAAPVPPAAKPDANWAAPGEATDGSVGSDAGNESGADASPPAFAHLTVGSALLDFGTVTAGQTLTPGTIDVTNTGLTSTATLRTTLTGAAVYTIASDGCSGKVLPAAGVCHVQIALNDAMSGTPAGSLSVVDTTTDAVSVQLQAQVIAPGALAIGPQSNSFGALALGTASASKTFTVTNTGMSASGALGVTLTPTSGSSASEFTIVDGCSSKKLTASGTCTISVAFVPAGRGARSATLTVTASPGGTATAQLNGTGQSAASLAVTPTSFSFPLTQVGAAPAPKQVFTITNSGDLASAALTTGLSMGTGTAAGEFAVAADTCAGAAVAGAGGTCTTTVSFNPATYGAKTATLNINGGALSASISGTAQDYLSLTVSKSGTGGGTVSDATQAISCGSTCSAQFARTATPPQVVLTATPDASSTFGGWSGACTGTSLACTVSLSAASSVTATFNKSQQMLTVNFRAIGGGQAGTITSTPAGISCAGPVCSTSASFDVGQKVTLSVSGLAAGAIGAWLPSTCTGSSCAVTMNAAQTVNYTSTSNNIIFVTSTTTTGNIGGLAGADAMCKQAAATAGLPGHYVSWLATSTVMASSRVGSARGWIRMDGLPFADTLGTAGGTTGLVNGQVYYSPEIDETGKVSDATPWVAWQNGNDAQTDAPNYNDCAGWTSASSTLVAETGYTVAGSRDWASTWFGHYCSDTVPIYCLGTDLTAPVTMATQSGRRAFESVQGFNASTGLAGADAICAGEASAAGLSGTFKAFLAASGTSAASRFNLSGANWVRTDGVLIANSITDLLAGKLRVSIGTHANGTFLTDQSTYGWTGAADPNTAGTMATTCNNWSSAANAVHGEVGFTAFTDSSYFGSWADCYCDGAYPILCFEN